MAPLNGFLPEPSSSSGIGLLALGFVAVLYVVERLFFAQPLPKDVPFFREPPGATRFSLKTRWAFHTDCANLYKEVYDKVSLETDPSFFNRLKADSSQYLLKGQAVVIPGLGFRNELILPPSSFKWVNTYNDKHLNASHAFADLNQAKYVLGDDKYIVDDWQGKIVKTDLNPSLDSLMDALNDEVGVAFDTYLGTNTGEWVEVNIYETMRRVIAQANSRFTVGLPLCKSSPLTLTKSSRLTTHLHSRPQPRIPGNLPED